ncbi:MAG TPA: hypothetical protein VLV83_18235 [Acidobacteriota bacterium]|nr:hypothetical protein [Acidobacteriota bacterium]
MNGHPSTHDQAPGWLRRAGQRVRFHWILSPKLDLAFYIGSALIGWLYVGLIWWGVRALDNPLEDPLSTVQLGSIEIPVDLRLLIFVSWAVFLDAPHLWATLGRTFCDPDEWASRRGILVRSLGWFALGPVLIVSPYALGSATAALGMKLPPAAMALGALGFFTFFRLWAYYHVVRQHWGFFRLYKRKGQDYSHDRLDTWFFYTTMFGPIVLFLTGSIYQDLPGFPDLGMHAPLVSGLSVADLLHPAVWALYLAVILVYLAHLGLLLKRGHPVNGSKLLYMSLLIPLHLVAFSHPIIVLFLNPIVTAGHNIQYHCIVYFYGRKKYAANDDRRYRLPRFLFSNLLNYGFVGLAFTFVFYRGPWIDWVKRVTGITLDEAVLDWMGMMAGITDPSSLALGQQVMVAAVLGFAMQHYYLDSKIWRVSKDSAVRKNLQV